MQLFRAWVNTFLAVLYPIFAELIAVDIIELPHTVHLSGSNISANYRDGILGSDCQLMLVNLA